MYTFNVEIRDSVLSDHISVLLDIFIPCHIAAQGAPACTCRMFQPPAPVQLSAAFSSATAAVLEFSVCPNSEELNS